ncbi:MAG: hypothetical protein BJ554DRAFT_5470 [Olpidium bornovanus]|uniref:Peptidase C19 ubiquitin carboxyl-terminal hydrolase domain-containing protein n=1 Tax=Olpidium bornovanus TaxID=278681 RepID=A0A8H7ZZJ9_9FUNG|nr:MAG: hypothetical protein BJ554DRAFT_5470 [Olpidium bornovanus]
MAAALQCLFSTAPLAHYLRSAKFQEVLRPRGTESRMAALFADLYFSAIETGGNRSPASPRALKAEVGRRNPMFEGCE